MSLVIVAGAIANKLHNGGEAWVRLSWLRGFQQMGFQVHFVEQMAPGQCVDSQGNSTTFSKSINRAYFANVFAQCGLSDQATLVDEHGEATFGLSRAGLLRCADEATVMINISGHLKWPSFVKRVRRKVLIDIDPVFTQLWHDSGDAGANIEGHDDFFTIGANIGKPDCTVPTGNLNWRYTLQPVVLDDWPVSSGTGFSGFSTIANWRGPYGPLLHQGKTLGLKVHEFRKFAIIPELIPEPFEIALNIHPADENDLQMLLKHHWSIIDAGAVTSDPQLIRRYIQASGAEFSVAQGAYVETQCGWFSDRSVRYLASGKPVLVQDTGLTNQFPLGEGLFAFRNLEQAVAGAEQLIGDYPHHCIAARRLAEQYFDSKKVIGKLIDELGIAP